MQARRFHLAEFNISRLKAPLDSPVMKEFVDFLEPVNRFAEESTGYVWRLVAPDGQASSYLPPAFEDEMIVTNLTVWEDIESLKNFVYQTVHTYFLRSRKKWFEQVSDRQVVLWWIPKGHLPTLEEAKEKLRCLQEIGPGPDAFTFQDLFDSEGNPILPGLRGS
ncbi:MAG TPA: DUF3291 domain-containing protein [Anaerolineales bacterium]|nr:DUF3291 domain-containing protein [Anaerolineales bacterium]